MRGTLPRLMFSDITDMKVHKYKKNINYTADAVYGIYIAVVQQRKTRLAYHCIPLQTVLHAVLDYRGNTILIYEGFYIPGLCTVSLQIWISNLLFGGISPKLSNCKNLLHSKCWLREVYCPVCRC